MYRFVVGEIGVVLCRMKKQLVLRFDNNLHQKQTFEC